MLVATPGQTASYQLHSNNASKKQCHTSSVTPKNSNNNLKGHTVTHSVVSKLSEAATGVNSTNSSATSTLMKTLSVRLNRGTEFLKNTVQKALISTTNANIKTTAATTTSHAVTTTNSNNTTATTINTTAIATTSKKIISPTFLKLYTVPPTHTHRFPEAEETKGRKKVGSADSLQKEMCHFKPIRTAPISPWKSTSKSRGAALKTPKALLATKSNLFCDDPLAAKGEDCKNVAKTYASLRPKSSSVFTKISSSAHKSAFVSLRGFTHDYIECGKQSKESKKAPLACTKGKRGRTKATNNLKASKTTTLRGQKAVNKKLGRPPQKGKAIEIPKKSCNTRAKGTAAPITRTNQKIGNKTEIPSDSNKATTVERSLRKRKANAEFNEFLSIDLRNDIRQPTTRKRSKLTEDDKDCSNDFKESSKKNDTPIRNQDKNLKKTDGQKESPPLTRSRLKQSKHKNLVTGLVYHNRHI